LTISLPVIAAVFWATFRAPGDASAGPPIVAVPGPVRLLLEAALFGGATWGLYNAGATQAAWILGVVTLLHYLLSYDRLWWLLQNKGS
jgi:hypothetical protein